MSVPETPMNKHNYFVFREDDIGPAGKVFNVKTEAKATAVQSTAQQHFRLRILSPDTPHIQLTLCGGQDIHVFDL